MICKELGEIVSRHSVSSARHVVLEHNGLEHRDPCAAGTVKHAFISHVSGMCISVFVVLDGVCYSEAVPEYCLVRGRDHGHLVCRARGMARRGADVGLVWERAMVLQERPQSVATRHFATQHQHPC